MSADVIALPKRRSGSKKRRRKNVVNITLDDMEFAVTQEKAGGYGLSLAAFGRASMLGDPGPRSKRAVHINAKLLAYAVAQLNRAGNNLNQILRILNAAHAVEATETAVAVAELRAAVRQICDSLGR